MWERNENCCHGQSQILYRVEVLNVLKGSKTGQENTTIQWGQHIRGGCPGGHPREGTTVKESNIGSRVESFAVFKNLRSS